MTDASGILQEVKRSVGIICRKRRRELEEDNTLGGWVIRNKIILLYLIEPDGIHQCLKPTRTDTTKIMRCPDWNLTMKLIVVAVEDYQSLERKMK